jgi:hypothetical protein
MGGTGPISGTGSLPSYTGSTVAPIGPIPGGGTAPKVTGGLKGDTTTAGSPSGSTAGSDSTIPIEGPHTPAKKFDKKDFDDMHENDKKAGLTADSMSAEKEKKGKGKNLFGSILGAVGGVVGTAFGGPIGGAVGEAVGGAVGGAIDGK